MPPKSKFARAAKTLKRKVKKTPSRRSTPLWTPDKGITQSALLSFLNNPEEFAQNYIEGWTPKGVSVPPEFGNVFHLMEETRHVEPTWDAEKIAHEVGKAYLKARRPNLRHPGDVDTLKKLIVTCKAIYPVYYHCWLDNDEDDFDWLGREHIFSTPHKVTTGDLGITHTINLTGMRDGEYRIKKKNRRGKLGLRETKTKGSINKDELIQALKTDAQVMFYLFSMYLEYEEYPVECDYNVIRRPALRQRNNESLREFSKRIQEDAEKRLDFYFWRATITVMPYDIDAFVKQTLNPAILLLMEWWRKVKKNPFDRFQNPFHIHHLPALSTRFRTRSSYFDLLVKHDYSGYYQREVPFPELA